MHLVLFIAQIYSTVYISIGSKGFRVGIFSYKWEKVARADIITGFHEDNHKYPSGGVLRFFVREKIYRVELKNTEIEELITFLGEYVETDTH
ncbi:hypothetical protein ACJROX_09910 [Pseudalkalibacillus sp. A8]|uniref:hypothetical protein n=1 Tax=Pseudalkalibacillus sp. A8 TaxID=3382641 RepID=UPI0038B4F047